MRIIDKQHVEYHLNELSKQCDNRIRKVTCFWANDNLTSVRLKLAGGEERIVDTSYSTLPQAFQKVMQAL